LEQLAFDMSEITYDDFAKLDIRVAKIIATEPIEGKSRIIKGQIDLGNDDQRDVIIGGAQYFLPEEMVGKTVIVIANLESKKMAGVESNAMLLAADVDDKPFWLTVPEDVPLGSPIK
jgi:tRNA-binding protein